MYQVNSLWGFSQPNLNQNPFNPFFLPNNPFASALNHYTPNPWSNYNAKFTNPHQNNNWVPVPSNQNYNDYSPSLLTNPWNQRPPSSQTVLPRPTKPQPQPLPSSNNLRKKSKKRAKNKGANKHQKIEDRQESPSIQIPQIRYKSIQELRKDWVSLNIPTLGPDVEPHFLQFKKLLEKFLLHPQNPSLIFGDLVNALIMCSKNTHYTCKIRIFIRANLESKPISDLAIKERMAPHERLRMFWLLGEIFRPEYDTCFEVIRKAFQVDELFLKFLSVEQCEPPKMFLDEFQTIWCYWEKIVPKHITDKILKSCRVYSTYKYIMNSVAEKSVCEHFYEKTFGYNEYAMPPPIKGVALSPQYTDSSPITFDFDSNYYDDSLEATSTPYTGHEHWTPKFSPQGESTRHRRSKHVTHQVRDEKSQEFLEFEQKIQNTLSLLEKLLTVDSSDVPKTVSEVLQCFVEHGNDHKLSDRICNETANLLYETTNNSKIIRILWLIGYLFLPKHESKLTTMKPLIEKIAARLFWVCLSKTHKDTSSREEMRIILKFWREIVNEEITSSIIIRIKDATANDPETNMSWILDDKNIRKGTRMSHFYHKYTKASKTDPASDTKKTLEQFILDKCDVIQKTNNQKNWEDTLRPKQKSCNSLHMYPHGKIKKQKIGNQGGSDKPGTKFHLGSSKQVELDKPLLQTKVATDNNCMTNGDGSCGGGTQQQNQSDDGLSKLELFRKKMEQDEAIASIGGGHKWNDTSLRENKEVYLRQDWSVDEFVDYVCSEEFQTSWDFVKLESGELRVKIRRK